jgi:hypothetical protein
MARNVKKKKKEAVRYWDHALETVNCVGSGKCCRHLIPKCDRPGAE